MKQVTPKSLKQLIVDLSKLDDAPVIMVWGKPGIGKTWTVQDAAKEINYEYLPLSLGRVERVDLNGAVSKTKIKDEDGTEREYTVFSPPLFWKKIFDAEGKVILHLDEFTGAEPEVQNACLDIVLEKRVDNMQLPKNLIIVISGNLGDDGTFASSVTTALSSRGIVTEMKQPSVREYLEFEKVASQKFGGLCGYIEAFLDNNADFLNRGPKLEAPHQAWTCPRTWSLLNKVIMQGNMSEDLEKIKFYSETLLGEATHLKFADFVDNNSVNIEDLIAGKDAEWKRMAKLPATRRVTVYTSDVMGWLKTHKANQETIIKVGNLIFKMMRKINEMKDNVIAFAQELSVLDRRTLIDCFWEEVDKETGKSLGSKKVGFLFDEIKDDKKK